MTGKEEIPRREITAEEIAWTIQHRLYGRKKALFSTGENTIVALNRRWSVDYPTGTEHLITIHNRVPEEDLFSSLGVVITTFPRLPFFTPKTKVNDETLRQHVWKRWRFAEWLGGTHNVDPVHEIGVWESYKPEFSLYAEVLDDPKLHELEKVDPQLSAQVKEKAEKLYILARALITPRPSDADDEQQVKNDDFIAEYKNRVNNSEVNIRHQKRKHGRKENFIIDFRTDDNLPWETFKFNRKNLLVVYGGVAHGKIRYSIASTDQASRLAKALENLDGTDLSHFDR